MDWIFFILATLINPIIMLNLLIALMSDTYEKVQSTNIIADRKELLTMILEIENLAFWNRKRNDRSYLQICDDLLQEGEREKWVGKLKSLKTSMLKMKKKMSKF